MNFNNHHIATLMVVNSFYEEKEKIDAFLVLIKFSTRLTLRKFDRFNINELEPIIYSKLRKS